MKSLFPILSMGVLLYSCSVSRQVSRQANELLIKDSAIASGHIGISIYEPAAGKYWYNYNADKNFIPSSNVKLFTLYAAMKHLGDSLVGARVQYISDTAINIFPAGDPTFLHPDFKNHPLLEFINQKQKLFKISFNKRKFADRFGYGWAWDDYNNDYMVERSPLPVFGNLAAFSIKESTQHKNYQEIIWRCKPAFFEKNIDSFYTIPLKWIAQNKRDSSKMSSELGKFQIKREISSNNFHLEITDRIFLSQTLPFYTDGLSTAVEILKSNFDINISQGLIAENGLYPGIPDHLRIYTLHSQPTDSLLKPMMHRSDNFFAEQTLLMVSNETLGYMSDEAIIDSLLKTDLKDLPQQPRWVDGSGLSRYNLATPKSFVQLLRKIKDEFKWDRITTILPTGGQGTLKNYFKDDSGFVYAKTGTLSNNSALSGYLITKKNKLLIFSVLNNNYAGGATPVRRAVEKFLLKLREKY